MLLLVSVQSPAAERVYAETKESILSGDIPGGSLISEAEVARQLAVSRTPAREAFVRLAAEGLLSLLPRRGALVTPLGPTEAADLLEVRHALESGAVRRLARLPSGQRSERLAPASAAIADQVSALGRGDIADFVSADGRFHAQLMAGAANAIATGFYATLADRQRRMTAQAISLNGERLAHFVPEHRRLLELTVRGDCDGFAAALWNHLRDTHEALAPTL
jgi:DNA-binding GntR family transcriptional regulator